MQIVDPIVCRAGLQIGHEDIRKTGCAGRYAHAEQIRLLQEEGHVGVLTVLREAHFVVGVR